MARWELKSADSVTKSVPRLVSRPALDGSYGVPVFFDNERPDWNTTLHAHGMTLAEVRAEQVKVDTRGTVFTYTTATGETVTGILTEVSATSITGTLFFDVDLKIKRTDVTSTLG